MPELPEAETIVRGLRRPLHGRRIDKVEVLHPDLLLASPRRFRSSLARRTFGTVRRRGKNLLLEALDEGAPPRWLLVNLGMSGRLLHREAVATDPPPTHPGVRFALDDGSELVYHDPRRFGRLTLLDAAALDAWSRTLGPEPLGPTFTEARLLRDLARSASPIRSWLLDQRRVAGVGNIYANEALFLARIDPRTPANRVPEDRIGPLHRAIRDVLREAIRSRGTTLRDYRTAQGWEGSYGSRLRVYGREEEPCPSCGTPIERVVFGGRSAFLCRRCQPEAPAHRSRGATRSP